MEDYKKRDKLLYHHNRGVWPCFSLRYWKLFRKNKLLITASLYNITDRGNYSAMEKFWIDKEDIYIEE